MRPTLTVAFVPCLAALAVAQEANLTVQPQKDPVHVGITSTISNKAETEILMNGEPMDFGGGRGGGGRGGRGGGMFGGPRESTTTQTVEFENGDGWRKYHTVEALVESTGRDGELVENEIAGALAGKKVELQQDEEGNLILVEGEGDEAQELNRMMSRGIHMLDFASLLPGKTVEVGGTFEVGNFGAALQGLMHPVVPEMPEGFGGRGPGAGQGGGRGGRGRGGDQGGRGQGGGGRRGAFGGGMRGMRGASNPLDSILAAEGLEWKGMGKLVSVEGGIAAIEIEATVSGEGSAEELGLPAGFMGRMGGRGGRGGGRGGEQGGGGENNAVVALTWKGTLHFDVDAGMIKSLALEGKLDDKRTSKREMNRGGESGEIETNTKTEATVSLKVDCKPAQ